MANRDYTVFHVTSTHHATDGRIFHRQARALAQAGFNVSVVAPGAPKEPVDGIQFIDFPAEFHRAAIILMPWRVALFLNKLEGHVYHFHDPDLLPTAGWLARMGKRVIYDCHEWYQQVFPHKGWNPIASQVAVAGLSLVERWALPRLSAFVAPTDELAEVYEGRCRRVVSVRNFAPFRGWDTEPAATQAKQYDIIHVGTVSRGRLDVMLQVLHALNRKRKARLCLLGVSREMKRWVESNPGNTGLVEVIERVPETMVPAYLCQARIGFNYHPFQPRFQVAIPMKVFEYMRHGLPFVSSALEPLKKLVGDTCSGVLVQENTVDAFVAALDHLLGNVQRMTEMGQIGRHLAEHQFNWQAESDKLVRLYDQILSE